MCLQIDHCIISLSRFVLLQSGRTNFFLSIDDLRLQLGGWPEAETLLDGRTQLGDGLLKTLLLDIIDGADRVQLGDTTLTELDADGEEWEVGADLLLDGLASSLVCREGDVGWGDETGFTLEGGTHDLVSELGTGLSHRQGGGTSTGLCLDDFVTTELDAVDESVSLGLVVEDLGWDGWLGLGEEWEDGDTGVTTDDWDGVFGSLGGITDDAGDEGGSSEDVEGGDTEEPAGSVSVSAGITEDRRCATHAPLGVVDTLGLQNLSEDRDGRVDWVGDDKDEGLWAGGSDGLGEGGADSSVDLVGGR